MLQTSAALYLDIKKQMHHGLSQTRQEYSKVDGCLKVHSDLDFRNTTAQTIAMFLVIAITALGFAKNRSKYSIFAGREYSTARSGAENTQTLFTCRERLWWIILQMGFLRSYVATTGALCS